MWLEAALPLGIIAGMISVMGNAQYYIHKAAHGRVPSFYYIFLLNLLDLIVQFSFLVVP